MMGKRERCQATSTICLHLWLYGDMRSECGDWEVCAAAQSTPFDLQGHARGIETRLASSAKLVSILSLLRGKDAGDIADMHCEYSTPAALVMRYKGGPRSERIRASARGLPLSPVLKLRVVLTSFTATAVFPTR